MPLPLATTLYGGYGPQTPAQGTFIHTPRREEDSGRVKQGLWGVFGVPWWQKKQPNV